MPINSIYTNIEFNGIKLDFNYMEKVREQNIAEINSISSEFFKKIGYEFNLNSTQQLAEIMKKKLNNCYRCKSKMEIIEFTSDIPSVVTSLLQLRCTNDKCILNSGIDALYEAEDKQKLISDWNIK
jgi:DNA polymerase I-like protein with 3'-5' exonuclease and polymerase domains